MGTIKEADLEAVIACDPDVIFIGGRLAPVYDDLSQIAPVVFLSTGAEKDPEYIFVLNRDAAIVSDGADRARRWWRTILPAKPRRIATIILSTLATLLFGIRPGAASRP